MPISDCEVRDPRVRRTRQLLQGALHELMRDKNFDAISVQDIADAATVNRATFYDHYTDKFALLDAMVAGSFHQLLHERGVRYDGTCPSAARAVILATWDFILQAHANSAVCERQSASKPLIDAAIVSAIRSVLWRGLSQAKPAYGLTPEMIASTASWAIYGAVSECLQAADRPSVEEAVAAILQLVQPILQAADAQECKQAAS